MSETLYGINVSATIRPFTTADTFPTHEAIFGKGGYRTVDAESDLTSIPLERLEEGMLVYTKSSNKIYKYIGDTSSNVSSDWEELILSSDFDKYVVVEYVSDLENIHNPSVGTLAYVIHTDEVYKFTSGNTWSLAIGNSTGDCFYKIVDEVADLSSIVGPFSGLLAYVKQYSTVYVYINSTTGWQRLVPINNIQTVETFTSVRDVSINYDLSSGIPNIIVLNTAGEKIYPNITYVANSNRIVLTFSQDTSGTVYIN